MINRNWVHISTVSANLSKRCFRICESNCVFREIYNYNAVSLTYVMACIYFSYELRNTNSDLGKSFSNWTIAMLQILKKPRQKLDGFLNNELSNQCKNILLHFELLWSNSLISLVNQTAKQNKIEYWKRQLFSITNCLNFMTWFLTSEYFCRPNKNMFFFLGNKLFLKEWLV